MFPCTPAWCGVGDCEGCVEREGCPGGLEVITLSTAWETCHVLFWQGKVFRTWHMVHYLFCFTDSPLGPKNQICFLLVCSNCQNIWLNECQPVSWRQCFQEGKTVWWSPGSPASPHSPAMENPPPHWSPGRHVAGCAMPADHRHRHHWLIFSSRHVLIWRSDLSPFSAVVWIPPEGLRVKFFL